MFIVYITFIVIHANDVLSRLYHAFYQLWIIDGISFIGITGFAKAQPGQIRQHEQGGLGVDAPFTLR